MRALPKNITALALLAAAFCALCGCTTLKVLRYNFPETDNYNLFANREVRTASNAYRFKYRPDVGRPLDELRIRRPKDGEVTLREFLDSSKTLAFVVIKDDAMVYEKYFCGAKEDTLVNSFPITKSFISALVGIAISEGRIKSIDQTVADLLPEFRGQPYGPVTIRNLLQMTSGITFSFNGISPFADNAQFYYGSDLRRQTAELKAKEPQGKVWQYKESDPQMLAFILERVTGGSVSKYLEEKIWRPMGAEFDANWSLDSAEHAKKKLLRVSTAGLATSRNSDCSTSTADDGTGGRSCQKIGYATRLWRRDVTAAPTTTNIFGGCRALTRAITSPTATSANSSM